MCFLSKRNFHDFVTFSAKKLLNQGWLIFFIAKEDNHLPVHKSGLLNNSSQHWRIKYTYANNWNAKNRDQSIRNIRKCYKRIWYGSNPFVGQNYEDWPSWIKKPEQEIIQIVLFLTNLSHMECFKQIILVKTRIKVSSLLFFVTPSIF